MSRRRCRTDNAHHEQERNDVPLTVKNMAEMTGLSVHTIRYYLKEGLLPTVGRNEHGVHIFRESDLENFYMIECMKRCGMSIAEIRQYLTWLVEDGDSHIDDFIQIFERQHDKMTEKLAKMQECLDSIEYKLWYYKRAKEEGSISIHSCMEAEDVPERMAKIRANMMNAKQLIESD